MAYVNGVWMTVLTDARIRDLRLYQHRKAEQQLTFAQRSDLNRWIHDRWVRGARGEEVTGDARLDWPGWVEIFGPFPDISQIPLPGRITHTPNAPSTRTVTLSLRFQILQRDEFQCRYCGARPPSTVLEVDHVTPVHYGGLTVESNLVTACFRCNRGKRTREIPLRPAVIAGAGAWCGVI